MAEISNGYFEFGVGDSEVIFEHKGVNIGIPEKPWMPTRAGIEVRVWGSNSDSLVEDKIGTPDLSSELLRVGKVTMISAEVAGIFSEADDPKNPDWYDKPWFNLNFNSHLGVDKIKNFMCQVYLRARTMGQMRALKAKSEYVDNTDHWSNPYWTPPIPVDYPLNPADRGHYDSKLKDKLKTLIKKHFSLKSTEEKLKKVRLFSDDGGRSLLERDFQFKIGQGNYPVWQKGDYLLVTQDNPLVDRRDGIHLVLIYRGEQEDESKRHSFLWRDLRIVSEMAIIAAAASKIITMHGYSGNEFDKSYIHLNANWSLAHALPIEERDEIMDFGSVGPGKWPGLKDSQVVPGPNAHPHIQILKKDRHGERHEFILPPSGKHHGEHPKNRQTDEEIKALERLLGEHLTPLLSKIQGSYLDSL